MPGGASIAPGGGVAMRMVKRRRRQKDFGWASSSNKFLVVSFLRQFKTCAKLDFGGTDVCAQTAFDTIKQTVSKGFLNLIGAHALISELGQNIHRTHVSAKAAIDTGAAFTMLEEALKGGRAFADVRLKHQALIKL